MFPAIYGSSQERSIHFIWTYPEIHQLKIWLSNCIPVECDHANNNKSGFTKGIYSDTSTTRCSSHQADVSQWQCQLSSNVNLTTLIKHANLQRTSSKRLLSLRMVFWKSSAEYNTFGYFPECLQVNKPPFHQSYLECKDPPQNEESAQAACCSTFPSQVCCSSGKASTAGHIR